MKLDKRINKIAIIYDCFDCKDARTSIGEKGYFSHYYHCFSDLSECRFGVLQDVIDSEHPYDNGKNQYDFFLPERNIINSEKQKQYRPYTFMEFTDIFTVGSIITFRSKAYRVIHNVMFISHWEMNMEFTVLLGDTAYSLEELFEEYEYQNTLGRWVPFGVEDIPLSKKELELLIYKLLDMPITNKQALNIYQKLTQKLETLEQNNDR